MSQLARFERHVIDTSGNAQSGASVTVYREGATVNGDQSGVTPLTVTVRDNGKIAAADTVFINTTTGTTYTVDSTTATTVVLSGFAGTLALTNGDRIIPSNSLPTLYADDQAGATKANPLTTSATGLAEAYIEFGAYDYIVDVGGVLTLFQGSVATTEMVASGFVNVRAFGAKGDDSTDDTAAITAAILEASQAGYSEVFFPPGVYRASQIVLKTSISLIGSGTGTSPNGKGTQLKQISGTNTDFIVSDTALAATGFQHNSRIHNLYIRGNSGDATGSGIRFNCRTGETLEFSKLVVGFFPESGIRLTNGVTPLNIDNVQATNNGLYGIDINRSGADLNHYVRLNHISGDDNGTALIRIKTSGGVNKGETYCITGVKAEKITNPKQNNVILLEDLNGSPVFIAGVGGTNSSGVAANALVRIITSSARVFWCGLDRDANYTYIVDDVPNALTYSSASTAAFGTNAGFTLSAEQIRLAAGLNLTISGGVVTATNTRHKIDTEAAAATDDLDTINGGISGQLLVISSVDSTRDPTAKDGAGNLRLNGDFVMDNTDDRLTLISDGTNWFELARSSNA